MYVNEGCTQKDAKMQDREWGKKGRREINEREETVVMMQFVKRRIGSRSADHRLGNVSEWDSVAESQNRIKSNKHESASE